MMGGEIFDAVCILVVTGLHEDVNILAGCSGCAGAATWTRPSGMSGYW